MKLTEQDTFDALRTPKYRLQIIYSFFPDCHFDDIINSMRTTIESEPDILPSGDSLYTNLTAQQVAEETCCLGYWCREVEEKYGIADAATFRVDLQN